MTHHCGKLCSAILSEYYGELVPKVADVLFKYGPQPLPFIVRNTKIPLNKVKECLCILSTFSLVEIEKTEQAAHYKLYPERILLMMRHPGFMLFVKNCSGDECEMMLEEFLKQGFETASQIIIKACYRRNPAIKTANSQEQTSCVQLLIEKFEVLLKNQFITRQLPMVPEVLLEDKIDSTADTHVMPNLNIPTIVQMIQGNEGDPGDDKIYWKVNFDRLIQDLRDQLIVETVSRVIDENAGQLMRQIIFLMYERTALWSHTSNPIPSTEIKMRVLDLNIPSLSQNLEHYLKILGEEPCSFLRRFGDSSGGHYVVNVKEILAQLAWATIERIVMERFGFKAARIFRLVRIKQHIEQEHIHQQAMIQPKEAKHLTFILVQERYLNIQELKKSGRSIQPHQGIYLFQINLDEVVRMEIDRCYHALYNLMQRRRHQANTNKRIIEKNIRIQVITSQLREEDAPEDQISDVERMLSPHEREELDTIESSFKIMGSTEIRIEETLQILKLYLAYHCPGYLTELFGKK